MKEIIDFLDATMKAALELMNDQQQMKNNAVRQNYMIQKVQNA